MAVSLLSHPLAQDEGSNVDHLTLTLLHDVPKGTTLALWVFEPYYRFGITLLTSGFLSIDNPGGDPWYYPDYPVPGTTWWFGGFGSFNQAIAYSGSDVNKYWGIDGTTYTTTTHRDFSAGDTITFRFWTGSDMVTPLSLTWVGMHLIGFDGMAGHPANLVHFRDDGPRDPIYDPNSGSYDDSITGQTLRAYPGGSCIKYPHTSFPPPSPWWIWEDVTPTQLDDFKRAPGLLGGNWLAPDVEIQNIRSAARPPRIVPTTNWATAFWTRETLGPDCYAATLLNPDLVANGGVNNGFRLYVRADPIAGTGYYAEFDGSGSGSIHKYDGTSLGSFSYTPGNEEVAIAIIGNTIYVVSSNDYPIGIVGAVSDSSYSSAGYVGCALATGTELLNFHGDTWGQTGYVVNADNYHPKGRALIAASAMMSAPNDPSNEFTWDSDPGWIETGTFFKAIPPLGDYIGGYCIIRMFAMVINDTEKIALTGCWDSAVPDDIIDYAHPDAPTNETSHKAFLTIVSDFKSNLVHLDGRVSIADDESVSGPGLDPSAVHLEGSVSISDDATVSGPGIDFTAVHLRGKVSLSD